MIKILIFCNKYLLSLLLRFSDVREVVLGVVNKTECFDIAAGGCIDRRNEETTNTLYIDIYHVVESEFGGVRVESLVLHDRLVDLKEVIAELDDFCGASKSKFEGLFRGKLAQVFDSLLLLELLDGYIDV